ncbi:MAG: iron-sulfur cluster assembly protein [Planctomycetes bacterium]|nr:iron-sulfur cluster assembly protein [Planctomycetota bacterium]
MIFEGNEAPEPEDPPQELPGPEDRELTPLEEDIRLVLKSVYDPEVPVDIYDLGLVYNFSVNCEGKVDVKMTLTSPACPVAGTLPIEVESKIRDIDGITQCNVDLVWDPPWDPSMMTEAARLKLNL